MPVTAIEGAPGQWLGTDWSPGTAGLFAVVIGVSDYPYLADGATPAPETYELGQLTVSAVTAWRVFEWLRDDYRVEDCPLARVWLLLAPTPREILHEPALNPHRLMPTIDNCQLAIGQWLMEMQMLPLAAGEQSRALFFFSGHGLEIHQNRQILLPSDYLSPPIHNVNNALSTENLVLGLASLAVRRQFFFLDACRNDNQKLREKRISGRAVLNEEAAVNANPEVVSPVLYATASGQQAFQQPDPAQGLSLFGTALLDGLAGRPDIELLPAGAYRSVNVYPLQGFVKSRIIKLLEQANERVRQPVKLGGSPDNEIVTVLPLPLAPANVIGQAPSARERVSEVERALAAPFSVGQSVPEAFKKGGWSRDYSVGHTAFGSESATGLWSEARLIGLSNGKVHDATALVLHQVLRDPATRRFRLELSVSPSDRIGYWLELNDGQQRYGAVLPADRSGPLRYLVEFDLEYRDLDPQRARRISRFETSLAAVDASSTGIAARLWQTYNASDAGTVADWIEDQRLAERLLRDKFDSPLAAAIASLVLLRAGRLDLLHDWVRNLANRFTKLPDGATLWAEQILNGSRQDGVIKRAALYTTKLNVRGLPMLTETMAYAARHVALLRGRADVLDAATVDRLNVLEERIARVLVYFRADGLFPVFSGYDDSAQVLEPLGLGAFAPKSLAPKRTLEVVA